MSTGTILALVAAAVLVFWMLGAYNRLIALRNAIGQAWAQVDAALAPRGAAVLQQVAALREGGSGETDLLDDLVARHAEVAQAADVLRQRPVLAESAQALVQAETQWAAAAAQWRASVAAQAGLGADEAVRQLMTDLHDAEVRLQFARQLFNDAAQAYNEAARQWPTRLVARLYGFGTAGRL